MSTFNAKLAEVVKRDPRYTYEAYEFVFQALHHAQKSLGRVPAPGAREEEVAAEPRHHVSGPELLEGARLLALQQFGLMARTVLRMWGIGKTDDIGEIVFNLIEAELMSKTADDTREDFHDVFDLDTALVHGYRIEVDEAR
jgi:uncharacterized repeat protein (TIGR04138 family)